MSNTEQHFTLQWVPVVKKPASHGHTAEVLCNSCAKMTTKRNIATSTIDRIALQAEFEQTLRFHQNGLVNRYGDTLTVVAAATRGK